MTELHVVATIEAKPEAVDQIRDALKTLVASSRTEEGCTSYDVYESAAAPGTFVTVEVWASQADLDRHLQSPELQQTIAGVSDKLASAPAIHPLQAIAV
ncbi:putative quinol monooxygenase [Antrihabitans cavernicola]|uniref:Antibiotic biosynthesis monooxygenase n=1 Tax=Antrihabitans cavernicola TaxID=2495913 RepID=A0A5A7S8R4_9NOCA|nr:putative quinol monooxygenase [Spelaeibacter cavernicola]KAA0018929.1 antibiotic biosynthesis monooxygenase [Spelaeibacter cavernicola]